MVNSPLSTCKATYVDETAQRLTERVTEHVARDNNSHLYEHLVEGNPPRVSLDNFVILPKQRKEIILAGKFLRVYYDKAL